MEFGVQLSNLDWPALRDQAQMAEGLGFGAIFVPDHLAAEGPARQFDPHLRLPDPFTALTVIAEATRTVRIGPLVLCNLFRHPATTAQALTSLDGLSNGRLYAGLGSGWTEREFAMTGIPFPEIGTRLRQLDESLACIRSLWTNETTTFEGEFYQLRDAISWPKPVQRPHPPLLLGGGGKGLLRVAARHADIVNIISDAGRPGFISMAEIAKLTNDSFRSKVAFLRAEADRLGRDGKSIRISNFIFAPVLTANESETQTMAEAMAPMFQTSPEAIRHSPLALIGTPEACVTELQRRAREWEVSQVVFASPAPEVMQRLAQEVLRHV